MTSVNLSGQPGCLDSCAVGEGRRRGRELEDEFESEVPHHFYRLFSAPTERSLKSNLPLSEVSFIDHAHFLHAKARWRLEVGTGQGVETLGSARSIDDVNFEAAFT